MSPTSTKFTQADRQIAVATPLRADLLLLETVAGAEELSRLFRYELTMLALEDDDVPFEKLLGQPVTVTIAEKSGVARYVNGIVSALTQGDRVVAEGGGTSFIRYLADVVPKPWLLTKSVQSRIFQQKSVPDILKAVFDGYPVSHKTTGTYQPRDYCVQYRESDFDFASRLMEEEGIYYFFEHADGKHTMVLADAPDGHPDLSEPTARYATGGTSDDGEAVLDWRKRQAIRSGKVTLWDYTFEKPDSSDHLAALETATGTVSVGTVSHSRTAGGADTLEVFDFPGRYAPRFDGVDPGGTYKADPVPAISKDGPRTVKIRLKEETWPGVVTEGTSDVRRLTAGYKFKLDAHPHADGTYVLVRVALLASIEGAYTSGKRTPLAFRNKFTAIPAATPFAPARVTPKPRVDGLQTAVVVGPPEEEIATDKYARVKVQFHWDRQGKNDLNSSCWVRVSSPWAGQQWGMVQIPRVGHEVLIGFEDGDPDQPVIIGSLYNAKNMPPYTLPDNKTQSGWKSRSTTKGDAKTFNELRFEDKKDAEQVYFHAERDFARVVENNDDLKVGFEKKTDGNQTVQIFNNQSLFVGAGKGDAKDGSQKVEVFNTQTVVVGAGKAQAKDGSQSLTVYKDRTATIQTGDDKLSVQQGNRLVEVAKGNDTHVVKMGDRAVQIDLGNDALTVKTGNQTTKVSLGSSKTEAMQSIELKVGGSSFKMDPSGISMKGMVVKIEGSIQVQMKGTIVQVNGDGFVIVKGGIAMIN